MGSKRFNKGSLVLLCALLAFVVAFASGVTFIADAQEGQSQISITSNGQKYIDGEALICVKSSVSNDINDTNNLNDLNNQSLNSINSYSIKSKVTSNPLSTAVENCIAQGGENIEQVVAIEETKEANKLKDNNESNKLLSLDNNTELNQEDEASETCDIYLVNCADPEAFCKEIVNDKNVIWAQLNYVKDLDENTNPENFELIEGSSTQTQTDINADALTINNNVLQDSKNDSLNSNSSVNNELKEFPNNSVTNYSYVNNDPLYQHQWGFDGQTTGSAYSINADNAWKNATTHTENVVAVVDTGVDYKHEDVADNMWTGGNIPALTDLGGGIYGINTATNPASADVTDSNGHGTHCASAIASTNNNGKGVCGVANNNTKIMACRASVSGSLATADIIESYNYIIVAKQNNVNVCAISCSFGIDATYAGYDYATNSLLVQAGKLGIVSVFSAGNSNTDMDLYPDRSRRSPYSIEVGANTDIGTSAPFSCYGQHTVDVYSPGVETLAAASTDSTRGQYLPWIQSSDANWFYDDFTGSTTDVEFLIQDRTDDTQLKFNTLPYKLEDGKAKIELTGCSTTKANRVIFKVKKTDEIKALINEGKVPYIAERYTLKNCVADPKKSMQMAAVFPNGTSGSVGLLYNQVIPCYNSYSSVISFLPTSGKETFLNYNEDYLYFGLNIVMLNVGENPILELDDLGLGSTTSNYVYMNGTSMACPIVSGVAGYVGGLIGSSTSSSDTLKLIAAIKGSVNKNSALATKCITGGVVDLAKASSGFDGTDDQHNPVPQSAEFTNVGSTYECALKGYFFGSASGSVYLDGSTTTIKSWTDTEIKFSFPECSQHTGEIVVATNSGRTGKDYFDIKAESLGYSDLPLSTNSYTDVLGNNFTTSDLDVLRTATTNSYLYVLYGCYESDILILEKYDYSNRTWTSIDLSDLRGNFWLATDICYSMAGGANEMYFLYTKSYSSFIYEMHIATYSEKTNSFIFDFNVSSVCRQGDMICNVNGELWLAGKGKSGTNKRSCDIVKIFPDTGQTTDVCSFPANTYMLCGNMSVYNNKVVISDSTIYSSKQPAKAGESYWNNPYIYNIDTSSWSVGGSNLYHTSGNTDPNQFLNSSGVALDTGVLEVGMVKNYNSVNMIDHFFQKYTSLDEWETITSARFSSYKSTHVAAVCHNDSIYVVGKNGLDGKAAFRYMPLTNIGAKSQDVTLNVARSKKLTISGTTISSTKVYNATNSCEVTQAGILSGFEEGHEQVSVSAKATYNDKNVGTNKPVTVSFSLSGDDDYLYSAPDSVSLFADITVAPLSVSGSSATSKIYNGLTDTSVVLGNVTGIFDGDSVVVTPEGSFNDKTAAQNKDVNVVYSISGKDMGNYTAPATETLKANISTKPIVVTGFGANNKVYDSSTDASITAGTVAGLVDNDNVEVTATGSFENKNVANNKTVTIIYSLTGDDKNNYTKPANTTTKADITKASLTVKDSDVYQKTYNGDTLGTVKTKGALVGKHGSDSLDFEVTNAVFDSKDASSSRSVTFTYSISGTDSENYNVPANLVVQSKTISPKQLTISEDNPSSVNTKTYDGTINATAKIGTVEGVVAGEEPSVIAVSIDSVNFNSADASDAANAVIKYKTSGTGSANYIVPVDSEVTGVISKRPITVKADNKESKVDSSIVSLTYTVSESLISGNIFTGEIQTNADITTVGTYTITNKNLSAGSNYVITFINGVYSVTTLDVQTITFEGVIEGKVAKTYGDDKFKIEAKGGQTTIIYSSSDSSIASIDATSGEVTIKKPGSTVITATAQQSSQYASTTASYTLTINARQLIIEGTSVENKIYDSKSSARVNCGTLTNIIDGDDVEVVGIGSFEDKNVGENKKVTLNYSISGINASNYLPPIDDTLFANINPATITVTGTTVANKSYDQGVKANVTIGSLTGIFAGDSVTVEASGLFDSSSAGTSKTVTVTYQTEGTDKQNYNPPVDEEFSCSISALPLTISGSSVIKKTYDKTNVANVTPGSLDGVLEGDNVTPQIQSATYASIDAQKDIIVNVKYNLTGDQAQNYIAPSDENLIGEIEAKAINVKAEDKSSKVGTDLIELTYVADKLCSGDVFSGELQTNANKDVISDSYQILQGSLTAGRNYIISFTPGTYKVEDKSNQNLTFADIPAEGKKVTYGDDPFSAPVTGQQTAVTYSSSDSTVASVDASGSVTINKVGNVTIYATAEKSSDYYAATASYNLIIDKKQLTLTGSSVKTKTYDGTISAEIVVGALEGDLPGDLIVATGHGVFENKNVGTSKKVDVTYSIDGRGYENYYEPIDETLYGDLLPTKISVLGSTAQNKQYDSTTLAQITLGSVEGVVDGDDVEVKGSGSFTDKNVGTNIPVSISYILTGTDKNNYLDPDESNVYADISAAPLSVNGSIAENKTYDGTTKANIIIGIITGVFSGDSVQVNATGNFEEKNKGDNKDVTVTYALTGVDSKNYLTPNQDILKASIFALVLNVIAQDKVSTVGQDLVDLTYTCSPSLVEGDYFSGQLICNADKYTIGKYDILQGSLTAGQNYAINYTKGIYTVSEKKTQVISFDNVPGGILNKAYGDSDFTEVVSGAKTTVKYLSSDSSVASVETLTGNVSIHKPGITVITATADESAQYLPASASYTINISKCMTALVIAANSQSKSFDGKPLYDNGVHVVSGSLAQGDNIIAMVEGSIASVGVATNKISEFQIQHGSTDVTSYYSSIDLEDGTLTITPSEESKVKIDTEAINRILEKYSKMPEYEEKKLSVQMRTEGLIEDIDKEMIKSTVGSKETIYYSATLILTVDGSEKNIGDENTELVTISYKFDFNNCKDVQVVRVHTSEEQGKTPIKTIDELKTTPNASGEKINLDSNEGFVKVSASKYSTFGIAYTDVVNPDDPVNPPATDKANFTSNTGDLLITWSRILLGFVFIVALSVFGYRIVIKIRKYQANNNNKLL